MAVKQRTNSRKKAAKRTRKKPAKKKARSKKATRSKKARSKKKTSGRPRKGEMPAQLAAHAWPKGTSGNPAGRPKGLTLQERFERLIETRVEGTESEEHPDGIERADQMALAMFAAFMAGDPVVRREMIKRLWPVVLEIGGPGGGPIPVAEVDYIEIWKQKLLEWQRTNRDVDLDLPEGAS